MRALIRRRGMTSPVAALILLAAASTAGAQAPSPAQAPTPLALATAPPSWAPALDPRLFAARDAGSGRRPAVEAARISERGAIGSSCVVGALAGTIWRPEDPAVMALLGCLVGIAVYGGLSDELRRGRAW